MAFKTRRKTIDTADTPEALFHDLRNRTVEGLLSQQADALRQYMTIKDEKDIGIELPTRSGKTLVGLLIAEWRRRIFRERCVFLCPTRQLVNQVVEQSEKKYGIKVVGFTGSKKYYPPEDVSQFINCKVVAVSTYSSLFNVNPFFNDVQTIIFDDAHAAENYIASFWSLSINKHEEEVIKSNKS